jgi:outer membrane protein OmpA-like peptidoglycan-associated protein
MKHYQPTNSVQTREKASGALFSGSVFSSRVSCGSVSIRGLWLPVLLVTSILSGCQNLPKWPSSQHEVSATSPAPSNYPITKERRDLAAEVGALEGSAIRNYMDNQEQALREQLRGSSIKVHRDGDILRLEIPSQVTFAVGKSEIRAQLYPMLSTLAKVVAEYSKTMIVIIGHTDDSGSLQTNMQLSQQRAEAVKNYLLSQQLDARRIEIHGEGPNYPLLPNSTAANRAANRRVEILLAPLTLGG